MTAATGTPPTAEPPRHAGEVRSRPMPDAPPVPTARTRRRPALMALGVACIATGALASAWLVGRAGDRVGVLVVARGVPYGAVVTVADLSVTEVSVDPGVATVPAGDLTAVVGQVAAVPMAAGTLLAPSWLQSATPPAPGQVLVALAVPATRMPAGALAAGDRIRVVSTPGQDAEPPDAPPRTLAATVVRLSAADLDGVTVIDVAVAPDAGPMLAAWSATGRIALLLEPRTG